MSDTQSERQAGEFLGVDRGVIRQAEVNYARSLRPEDVTGT